jgi:hypothetical protein
VTRYPDHLRQEPSRDKVVAEAASGASAAAEAAAATSGAKSLRCSMSWISLGCSPAPNGTGHAGSGRHAGSI